MVVHGAVYICVIINFHLDSMGITRGGCVQCVTKR
jgi:hypothetical protein